MFRMVFLYVSIIISTSLAEDFLKCSAVGEPNGKCVKDLHDDQEAQETNSLSAYDNFEPYDESSAQHPEGYSSVHFSDQNHLNTNKEYDFGYTVNDVSTGDQKFHRESKYNNVVHGTYSFIEADGSKRTVVYTADDVHGFKAVVYRDQVENINNIVENSKNTAEAVDPSYYDYQQYPDQYQVRFADPTQPNFVPNTFEPNFYLQRNVYDSPVMKTQPLDSNGQASVETNVGVLNQLHEILGQPNIATFLTKEESLPRPSHFGAVEPIPEIIDTVGSSANSLRIQLLSEVVKNIIPDEINHGDLSANPTIQSSINNFPVSKSPQEINTELQLLKNDPGKIMDVNMNPTQNPLLAGITQNSNPSVENFNSSAVVERPHHGKVTTPVPIVNDVSSSRLNSLSYGEFPLLAHISPSYARRYARHYV